MRKHFRGRFISTAKVRRFFDTLVLQITLQFSLFAEKVSFVSISLYTTVAKRDVSSKTRGEIGGLIPIVKAIHPIGSAAYYIIMCVSKMPN